MARLIDTWGSKLLSDAAFLEERRKIAEAGGFAALYHCEYVPLKIGDPAILRGRNVVVVAFGSGYGAGSVAVRDAETGEVRTVRESSLDAK